MGKTGHFFYSRKMDEFIRNHPEDGKYTICWCMIDGETTARKYTNWSDKPKSLAKWDDLEYLGYGRFVSCETVRVKP